MKSTLPNTGLLSISLAITVVFTSPVFAGMEDEEASLAAAIIQKSGITAEVAIERAQKEFPGVLYEYELEEYKDTFVHEVELLDPEQNKKHEIKIDISSGEVVQAFTERGNPWFEKDEAMDAAKTIKKRGFSMLNAMAQLPRDGSTLLTDAKFKQTQGISFFELEFFGQNGEEEILVNAATQSIIPRFKKN